MSIKICPNTKLACINDSCYQFGSNHCIENSKIFDKSSTLLSIAIAQDIKEKGHGDEYYKGDYVMRIAEDFELGSHLFQVLKYILRAGKKDQAKYIEDLEKAKWYLDRKLEQEKKRRK